MISEATFSETNVVFNKTYADVYKGYLQNRE